MCLHSIHLATRWTQSVFYADNWCMVCTRGNEQAQWNTLVPKRMVLSDVGSTPFEHYNQASSCSCQHLKHS
jgi:hypothetical protein